MAEEGGGRELLNEQRFRLLVDAVTEYAICMLDTTGIVVSWNTGAERITGYTGDAILGSPFSRFFTPEDKALGTPEQALRAAREEGRFEEENWRVRKDGTRFWANAALDRIRDERGALVGFALVLRDMSERRAARSALAESEGRFRMLVDSVVDYALFMLDAEGNIATWNAGAERIKGYAAKEIIGQHFSRFYTEEDRAAGEPRHALTLAAAGKYEKENWRVRKDGTHFWASVVIDPIRDETGRLIGFVKVTRDMSEQRKAQQALDEARAALMQSQKMEAIGQLTGGVAHDFNNLLTVVTNSLDLLANPKIDERQKSKLIASAQRAADRGAKLTQQLLAFARRQPLRPQRHDVNSLIRGFEAVLRRAGGEKAGMTFNLGVDLGLAEIDGAQFEAALLNLIVNAHDAMPQGGTTSIETQEVELDPERAAPMEVKPGRYILVRVKDTGEGMTEAVQQRAFDPFFTTKEPGKGSGLGLSQVYGFVAQSGGHVRIESARGKGTSVFLYLPVSPGLPRAERDSDRRRVLGEGTVLIVEDDPDVLEMAVATLSTLGYDVLTAGDGESALSVLRRNEPIDVLFSDVVMPKGMNGVELAKKARAMRPELRIILASGYPMSALSTEHGFTGEFTFLSKPYRWAELQDKLRAAASC